MPKNYFENRSVWSHRPSCLLPGDKVQIIKKELQGTRNYKDLTVGIIMRVLSKGKYYENGAKVEILNWDNDWTDTERLQVINYLKEATVTVDQLESWRKQYRCTIGRVQYVDF